MFKLMVFLLFGGSFGIYYLVNTTFAWTYRNQYHLDSGIVGACYLPMAFGGMVGGNLGGRLSDYVYNRNVAKAGPDTRTNPEMRLSIPVLGCFAAILLGALTGYGWCVQENIHYSVPIVFLFFGKCILTSACVETYTHAQNSDDEYDASACDNNDVSGGLSS